MTDQSAGQQAGEQSTNFNRTAIALSRNPLGIIALFIVLVYGFAALTISIPHQIDGTDRTIIVVFLVFPPVVLFALVFQVAKYPRHLYGPGDFPDPNAWLAAMLPKIEAATALAAATAVEPGADGEMKDNPSTIAAKSLQAVRNVSQRSWTKDAVKAKRILWVDDHPENNEALRRTFKTFNVEVTNALSTEQALQLLRAEGFDALISDMGRPGDPEAGHTLLKALREQGNMVPYFIYSRRVSPEQLAETRRLGGSYHTKRPAELFEQVADALGR